MVKLLPLPLCVLLFAFQQAPLAVDYDKFQDKTTVTLNGALTALTKYPDGVSRVKLAGTFSYNGKTLARPPETVELIFVSVSENWVYADDRKPSVIVLGDGKKIFSGNGYRGASDVASGKVIEAIGVDIPLVALKQLAQSKALEIQIGRIELALTTENMDGLKKLLAAANP